MRGYLLFYFSICLLPVFSCISRVSLKRESTAKELKINCEPSALLLQLLSVLNVDHENNMSQIIEATQKQWLRKQGSERWEMPAFQEDKKSQVMPILVQLGFVREILPSSSRYEYAVVLGASLATVRNRVDFLLRQWERGIRFEQIVFLGGSRPLHTRTEPVEEIINPPKSLSGPKKNWRFSGKIPQTETDMMKVIFSQIELPKSMENIKVTFVDAPMKQLSSGELVRPNTGDTILAWLELRPKPASVLVISSQPFVSRQDAVLRALLPVTFLIDTVGSAAREETFLAVYLDELARLLYQRCSKTYCW